MAGLQTFVEEWNGHNAFAYPLKFNCLNKVFFIRFYNELKFHILSRYGKMVGTLPSIKISISSKKWTQHLCAVSKQSIQTQFIRHCHLFSITRLMLRFQQLLELLCTTYVIFHLINTYTQVHDISLSTLALCQHLVLSTTASLGFCYAAVPDERHYT